MELDRFKHSPVGHLIPLRGVDGRTGRAFHHVAFAADPLGPEPPLEPATWHAVGRANRALARLDQASRQVPNPHLLRQPTLSREAQSTSALEGTFAPLEDVLAADLNDEADRSTDLREVLNYVSAASSAMTVVAGQPRITEGLLRSVHATLVAGTGSETDDAGRVRQVVVAIGGGPDSAIESSRFVPLPPGIELESSFSDLVRWMNDPQRPGDPLVAAALTHYQFETLHPFNDGNGRIGRLLVVLQFMADGLLSEPLLSVSPWFEARRREYQDRLAEVSATGDWDGWVSFFARGIEASADDTAQRVNRLLAIQRGYQKLVVEKGHKGAIRDIADFLIGTPIVTTPRLSRRLGVSQPAISTALSRLVDLGILTGPIGTYGRRFIATDVWNTVNAPIGRVPSVEEPIGGP